MSASAPPGPGKGGPGSTGGPGGGKGAPGGGKGVPGGGGKSGSPGGSMGKGSGGKDAGGGGPARQAGGMMGPGGAGGPGTKGGPGGGGMMMGPGSKGGGGGPGGGMMSGGAKGGMAGGGKGGMMSGPGGGKGAANQGGFMGADAGGPQQQQGGWAGPPAADATVHSSQMAGHMANMNAPGLTGIERRVKWKLLFFAGALCVIAAGATAILHFVFTFGDVVDWSPCTFISVSFLLIFGLLMMVLDLPMPQPKPELVAIRDHIYVFGLFLTRFTGRGMWYLFLGSHVWVALWDDAINPFFAWVFTLYLVILGAAALIKGFFLSRRLHAIRALLKDPNNTRVSPEQWCSPQPSLNGVVGMEEAGLQEMLMQVTNDPHQFTEDEMAYISNALRFSPHKTTIISLAEINYWLKDAAIPMLLV